VQASKKYKQYPPVEDVQLPTEITKKLITIEAEPINLNDYKNENWYIAANTSRERKLHILDALYPTFTTDLLLNIKKCTKDVKKICLHCPARIGITKCKSQNVTTRSQQN